MPQRRDANLNQPALLPIAGNFDRKPRSLDRDVTTIGRARGADLALEAIEISTMHCIIYRGPDGFRIRDCNSRCGTRVNGASVKTAPLHDGDILNIGPFSFEVRIPSALFAKDPNRPDPARIEHWKQSRKKLGQLALKLRRRVKGHALPQQEWAAKGNLLKEKMRNYDQRLRELEEVEKELNQEREQLHCEVETHRKRVQVVENDLAARLKQAEDDIHQRWQDFQKRCQTEETRDRPATPENAPAANAGSAELDEQRLRLRALEEQIQRQQEQVEREQREFSSMKEQWVRDQAKTSAAVQDQHSALAQQEASVRAQKAELLRMMGELKKMQEDLRKQTKPDTRSLQEELERLARENQELRDTVGSLEQQRAPQPESLVPSDLAQQMDDLRAEVQLLHEELNTKEMILQALQTPDGDAHAGELEKLRAENQLLKKLLEDRDQHTCDAPQAAPSEPKTEGDLERYEAELNEFRRQLETDRGKLNAECEMLRERNKELDEAIREMEMEMSKERAELARERIRLERVREEVKHDAERLQRELAVRDSMAPVQKLRDEMMQKQPGRPEKPVDRLKTVRNQLAD
jgi:chromosome segregation ATPase